MLVLDETFDCKPFSPAVQIENVDLESLSEEAKVPQNKQHSIVCLHKNTNRVSQVLACWLVHPNDCFLYEI